MIDQIGSHIALKTHISHVAQRALELELSLFQTFTITTAKKPFWPTKNDARAFMNMRDSFNAIYMHASYWINCASNTSNALNLMMREFDLVHYLEIPYVIIHPGAITTNQSRQDGIDCVARRVNTILQRYPHVTILLENPAHGGRTIGGNIHELGLIIQKIEIPERVGICIDTAHAHVYGYDLTTQPARDNIIAQLHDTATLNHVMLIHFNDTTQYCESKIDTHAAPGCGMIGKEALMAFIHHPALQNKPLILELPRLSKDQEKEIINYIRTW
jgi:deoxyribonuclease IV